MWRARFLLTCGSPLSDGVVTGCGFSLEVANFWERPVPRPGLVADFGELVAMPLDPSAQRVVAEGVAVVGLLAEASGDVLVELVEVQPGHFDVAAPVQVGKDRRERDGLGECHGWREMG